MYIAKKEGIIDGWDYFQDNVNDSPKWTKEKDRAAKFDTKEQALEHANKTGLYSITLEEI
jgi:hypothetical protein